MNTPILVSIQVGRPKTRGDKESTDHMLRQWRSAIFKEAVIGPVWLGKTNLAGDKQADLRFHGGPDKAVLAYSADHYPLWRAELRIAELPYGGFGENFTIQGLSEATVRLGDVYAIDEARVQVSQPRTPCFKLQRRWNREDMLRRVLLTGRAGWYLRVLSEGYVDTGQEVLLLERDPSAPTIQQMNEARFRKALSADDAERRR